jgi:ubiquinone/menaquinone biosynthesis C-methylase UbiE
MPAPLQHSLYVRGDAEQASKQEFVSGLRGYLLNDMAAAMKERYISDIEPTMAQKPKTGEEVHKVLKGTGLFKFYSSMRYNAQEMVWRSVLRPLHRSIDKVSRRMDVVSANCDKSKLTLNPNQEIPHNVSAIDVHLAPGSYHREDESADWMGGALYDHGLNIFSFGMMGENLDDIGQSMAQYIARKFPDFSPSTILDLGCTVGHNTCAWKLTFPNAEITGIDVASACLKYGHARALDQGVDINFKQMNATALDFADSSIDVVFSSMFLHELSVKDIRKVMEEAHRVLRPGGLMLHMELPPNDSMSPFDAFYLDWDAYYNNEPYYKSFRDQNFTQLRLDAGFKPEHLIELITPQYTYMDADAYSQAIDAEQGFDGNTGRLAEGLQWFGFGAWK